MRLRLPINAGAGTISLIGLAVLVIGLTVLTGYGMGWPTLYTMGGGAVAQISGGVFFLLGSAILLIGWQLRRSRQETFADHLVYGLVKRLTHDHAPETDVLLAQLKEKPYTQTLAEQAQLRGLLKGVADHPATPSGERVDAQVLLGLMEQVASENEREAGN